MLNDAETIDSTMIVPCTSTSNDQPPPITQPLSDKTALHAAQANREALTPYGQYWQGTVAGNLEAISLLAQVARRKGDTLTASEIREASLQRWVKRMVAWKDDGNVSPSWLTGWRKGFLAVSRSTVRRASTCGGEACSDASAAPTVTLTPMSFRQALVAVEDPEEFQHGLRAGQMGYVDEAQEGETLTAARVLREVQQILTSAYVNPDLSLGWYTGVVLGYLDALLRGRKTYPREQAASGTSRTGARA